LCEFDRVVEFVIGFLFAFSRLVELILQPVDLLVAGGQLEVQFGDHLLFCIQDLLKQLNLLLGAFQTVFKSLIVALQVA
jgi:hypothetical protein